MVDFPLPRARRRAPARIELEPKTADDVSLAVAIACVVLTIIGHVCGAW